MGVLLLGLVTGIGFGFILYRAGVSRCGCIFDALNLTNMKAVKLMMTAVGVGSLILYPLSGLGLVSLGGKTLYVWGVLVGGGIFGFGFAMAGYCPGTALASLGAGRKDALPTIIGALFGALAYSLVYEYIEPVLIRTANFGRHSLPEALGVNPVAMGIVWAGILLLGVFFIDNLEHRRARQAAVMPASGAATNRG